MNKYKTLLTGILVTSVVMLAQPQPVYAFDIGGLLLKSVMDYSKVKNELSYYNTQGSDELGAQLRGQYGVDEDAAKNEQLGRIMTNLTGAIGKKEKIDPQYKYFVNTHKDFNAFCALGHNVSVNSGLFDELYNDEDEIGFVIAHEMVHGQKNHSLNKVDKLVPINILQGILAQQSSGEASAMVSKVAGNYLVARQATLPGEWEADNIGFVYATDAGYNPGAGAGIWTKIMEKYGDDHKDFFGAVLKPSDHPTNSQRVNNYAKKLTEYSKGNVSYNPSNSYVMVKNKEWFKVAKSNDKSANERGYLIAGKLARVYHNCPTLEAATVVDGDIMMGEYQIVTPNSKEQAPENIAQKLNEILGVSN